MSADKRILLVDDDDPLRETLREQLELTEGFATDEAATGGEAIEKTKAEHFDLVLLDVGLPDLDGREVCRLMRKGGMAAPIIMLTASDTDADAILGRGPTIT